MTNVDLKEIEDRRNRVAADRFENHIGLDLLIENDVIRLCQAIRQRDAEIAKLREVLTKISIESEDEITREYARRALASTVTAAPAEAAEASEDSK